MVCRVVVLPAPLAPIRAITSPSFTSKEIPFDGLDHAIIYFQVFYFKHCHMSLPPYSPRYALTNLRIIQHIAGLALCTAPDRSSEPSASHRYRIPASYHARSEGSSYENCLAQNGWSPSVPAVSFGFIPAAGSSRSRSFGSVASALAISSFLCLP